MPDALRFLIAVFLGLLAALALLIAERVAPEKLPERLTRLPALTRWGISIVLIIAAAAVGLTGTSGASPASAENPDAVIELVEVRVVDDDKLPKVEFKVRNVGNRVAFMKEAIFYVFESRSIPFCPLPYAVPVSHVYDVELPAEPPSKPHTVSVAIAQAVSPNGVDRFQFRVGTAGLGDRNMGWTIYQFKVELLYNADKRVLSDNILMMVPYPYEALGFTVVPELAECFRRNEKNMRYMLGLPGTRSKKLEEMKTTLR